MEAPKSILIIDPICPKNYHIGALEGCGGTEYTVCLVAQALALRGHKVSVEMHNATGSSYIDGVDYVPKNTVAKADYVIVLRIPEALLEARERFPDSKLYLWCHDMVDNATALQIYAAWQATKPTYLIAVSEFHRTQIRNTLGTLELKKGNDKPEDLIIAPKIRVSYPPIYDDLQPDTTPYDKNKLCFISSPHKGLERALDLFKHIRRKLPDIELHVTNPGYYATAQTTQAGVKVLGSLDHSKVVDLLRSSLCLFFPNNVFPETFGRVYAEAEAVGTPVLTHNFGAATEALSDNREFVDVNNQDEVIAKVVEWYNGKRPTVRAKRVFRMSRVIANLLKEILV